MSNWLEDELRSGPMVFLIGIGQTIFWLSLSAIANHWFYDGHFSFLPSDAKIDVLRYYLLVGKDWAGFIVAIDPTNIVFTPIIAFVAAFPVGVFVLPTPVSFLISGVVALAFTIRNIEYADPRDEQFHADRFEKVVMPRIITTCIAGRVLYVFFVLIFAPSKVFVGIIPGTSPGDNLWAVGIFPAAILIWGLFQIRRIANS